MSVFLICTAPSQKSITALTKIEVVLSCVVKNLGGVLTGFVILRPESHDRKVSKNNLHYQILVVHSLNTA